MAGPDDWLPLSGIQHFCFCRYPGASPVSYTHLTLPTIA